MSITLGNFVDKRDRQTRAIRWQPTKERGAVRLVGYPGHRQLLLLSMSVVLVSDLTRRRAPARHVAVGAVWTQQRESTCAVWRQKMLSSRAHSCSGVVGMSMSPRVWDLGPVRTTGLRTK